MARGTMKVLCLVRHAAAGAAEDGTDMHRPLSPEGRQQALRLAEKLAGRGIKPDRIIASPADRTVGTAAILADALGVRKKNVRIDERIYHASTSDELLDVVRELDGRSSVVVLVGHQPVIGELALFLAPEFSGSFPKAGSLYIGLDVHSWKDIEFGKGRMLWFESG
jgi:phosphohistidine phosphatase